MEAHQEGLQDALVQGGLTTVVLAVEKVTKQYVARERCHIILLMVVNIVLVAFAVSLEVVRQFLINMETVILVDVAYEKGEDALDVEDRTMVGGKSLALILIR